MAKYDPDEFFEAERYPLPITCGECGHTMRPVHKHMVPDMPRTYFCTFCGAGFHEDDPGIRFREKRTNADRIRAMSDEELAKIHSFGSMRYGCAPHTECVGDCEQCWLDWLKSPAETLQEEE